MEDIEQAVKVLGDAAEVFLTKESFARSDAPLITMAEQMLKLSHNWQTQIDAIRPKPQALNAEIAAED